MSRQQFAVIGLGSFGETIAVELARLGHDVLGMDTEEREVEKLADVLTHTVVADAADEKALEELNIAKYDAVMVAIGENIEASLLCTLHLKSLGVKNVWVKALTKDHHRILSKLGATRIVHPEYEMGMRVAQALNYPMVNNYISLGDEDYIVEILATESLEGRTLGEVIDEAQARVQPLMIKRRRQYHVPGGELAVEHHDRLVLVGELHELRKLARLL